MRACLGHLHGRRQPGRVQDRGPAGHQRQRRRAPRRTGRHALARRPGGNGHRQGRVADDSGGERRAVVRRGDDDTRKHSAARGPQFRRARDARAGRRGDHPAGRRRVQQHHDGRRVHHGHGQQRPTAPDERRVDCGSEGVDLGVSGGVRPIERAADLGGHQERHEPVPRVRVRHSTQQQVELEQLGQQAERHSQPRVRAVGLGLLHRRAGRQAGREQQALLLLRAGVSAAARRRDDSAIPHADATGAGGRFLTVARQQRGAVQPHSRRLDRPSLHGGEHQRLLPGLAACSAGFRRIVSISPG